MGRITALDNLVNILRLDSQYHYQRVPIKYRNASRAALNRAYGYLVQAQQLAYAILLPFVSGRARRWATTSILLICLFCLQIRSHRLYQIAVQLADQSPIELIPYTSRDRFPNALYTSTLDVVKPFYFWENYSLLNGFYNGVKTLVPQDKWTPENGYNKSAPTPLITKAEARALPDGPTLEPVVVDPYRHFTSDEYLRDHAPVQQCFLDDAQSEPAPDVLAYPGVPQNMTEHFFGSYDLLDLDPGICYDRYSRFASYGYGYPEDDSGLGPGVQGEQQGADRVYMHLGYRNYTKVDWARAQERCFQKNNARFKQSSTNTKTSQHAFLLRVWDGFKFGRNHYYTVRAMITELSLKSGGEYDIFFLLHVKNDSLPWQTNSTMRQVILNRTLPHEFRDMAVFWSEAQMERFYPGPFPPSFDSPALVDRPKRAGIHGVLRSAHFPVQWFAQQHPEYDFVWNWEMDIRLTGHYYDFFSKSGIWAAQQPRKELWERNAQFYIPKVHGTWQNFISQVHDDAMKAGRPPIWGPVAFPNNGMIPSPDETSPPTPQEKDNYTWGVAEEADLIVFSPLFEPNTTNWQFRDDVTGYPLALPLPPRRVSIIGISRMSSRLLNLMHQETLRKKHTMWLEMWAPSVALHHGLKAVYVPHPVTFSHDWDIAVLDQTLNRPKSPEQSVFGWGEHNFFGSSYYFDSRSAQALWKRWMGIRVRGRGGKVWEERGTGRMCLRGSLLHPVKDEEGRTD